MSSRISWDRYEVALLLSSYERVAGGSDINTEAARLSITLRNLATRRGVLIDETYRNVNGMKMQLANVQYLFTDGKKGLSGASAMIRQMYELYTTNLTEYQMILEEANRMTGASTTSVEDTFFAYAKDKTGLPPKMLADYLQKAANYCHLKQPLLGMTDVDSVRNVQQKVAGGKLLRFRFGKNAQVIRNVTQFYYAFIKNYHKPEETVIVQPTRPAEDSIVRQAASDAIEQSTAENEAIISMEEIRTLDESIETVENATLQEEAINISANDQLLVDFSQDGIYLFTKPVSYTYKSEVHSAKSWNQIYVEICGLLFDDYRDAFMTIINADIPGYSSLAFSDEQHKSSMRVARCFAPGFYVESNLDATTIVRKIRGLYQLFGLGNKLQISYRRNADKGGEISEKAPSEEWIIVQLKARGLTYQDKRSWGGCLWIVGDHRLDSFIQECKVKGYMLSYKADGCKIYPNCPVWWTKTHVEKKIDISDFSRRLDENFKPFLLTVKNLAKRTADQYSQSIKAVERFMLERGLDCTLDTDDPDKVQRIYDALMGRKDFADWNNQYHHQYSAALAQYVGYLRQDKSNAKDTDTLNTMTIKEVVIKVLYDAGEPLTMSEIMQQIETGQLYKFNSSNPTRMVYREIRRYRKGVKGSDHAPIDVFDRFIDEVGQIRYMLIGEGQNATSNNTEAQETASADDRWLPILRDSFPDGYILNDFLGQFQAAIFWKERYGKECSIQGDAIDAAMKAIGVVRDGRVFVKNDEDNQLISAICAEINDILSHYTTVYQSCVYDRYQEQLASHSIYTEQVMVQQLLGEAKGTFHSVNQAFTKRGQYASVIQDARKVLRDHGGSMPVSDIAKVLWFVPYDMIYHCLSLDEESLNIGSSTWMLADHFPLTQEDANKIGDMLDEYFLSSKYLQASDLISLLKNRLPGIADDLNEMNYIAIFNIVAYYLRDRFSFTKAIISPKGSSIDFTALFKSFSAEHDTFTLADLEALASELKLPIYWECIYAGGAVRVSKTDFVNRRLINFDVDAIDEVLQDFCPGDYLPLMTVSSAMMMHLPSCGYRWNGYLLQSYVFGFSKVFGLSCSSFGKTGYYGAMVRRSCKTISNYGSLVERVLTDDDTWKTTAEALDVLVKHGYQALRKYKGIDTAAEKAKQNKLLSNDGR